MATKQEFVDNVKRRQFDGEEAEKRLLEKKRAEELKKNPLPAPGGGVLSRDLLQRRTDELNLESRVGKYTVVNVNTPLSQRGGFFCSVCDCLLKDSITYLDHINGRKHQQALGMSMRVERSTVAQVKDRLEMHKRKHEEEATKQSVEARLDAYEEEERAKKQAKKDKKKKKKRDGADDAADGDDDKAAGESAVSSSSSAAAEQPSADADEEAAMAAMGFAGFGGSKKR